MEEFISGNDNSQRQVATFYFKVYFVVLEFVFDGRICGGTGMHRTLSKWWEPNVVLRDWIERANEAVKGPVQLSDETAMRNTLSNLKVSCYCLPWLRRTCECK